MAEFGLLSMIDCPGASISTEDPGAGMFVGLAVRPGPDGFIEEINRPAPHHR